MTAKHTPGPWFATKDSKYNEIARIGRAWNISTELPLSHFGDIDADAKLIAAAPELLEAVRLLVHSADAKAYQAGRAAIAKATGTIP